VHPALTAKTRLSGSGSRLFLLSAGVLLASLIAPAAAAAQPSPDAAFKVAFQETGLPGNATWTVNLNGTVHSTNGTWVIFPRVANGTYQFSVSDDYSRYAPDAGTGNITVAGAPVFVVINFSAVKYSVIFEESGLPIGAPWSVDLHGTKVTTQNASVDFDVANGSYTFAVSTSHSIFSARPASGRVTVQGKPVTEFIAFNPVTYPVRFVREDSSTSQVTLNLEAQMYTIPADGNITVFVTNGTYSYSASTGVEGTSVPSGSFTVAGSGVTVHLVVSCGDDLGCVPAANPPSTPPVSGGITQPQVAIVILAFVAGGTLIVAGAVAWRSWKKAEDRRARNEQYRNELR
jgi:hypothetical protein